MQLRRGLPLHAEALGRLDPDALERVRSEAAPDVRGPEELHDLLLSTVLWRPQVDYAAWFDALAATGVTLLDMPATPEVVWQAIMAARR